MPIYEFICKKCGTKNEFLTGLYKEESLKCKNCGSKELEKVFSRTSVLSNKENPSSCCGLNTPCSDPKKCCGQ
ncbi:MAG: hypothetical protein JW871_00360 [Endomicrobiales bacterium]|nr:hypothetical protein [Endomicrobiales bacterium]